MKFKAKKSLGQNFLIDQSVIKNIIACANIENKDILEVGPGTGSLTKEIIKNKPNSVILIEKDDDLAEYLKNFFGEKITLINDDILKIDEYKLSKNKLIVFGNLPYNISTEILIKWIININEKFWFEKLILMFQKEVADRIISKFNKKNYDRLSIISQWKLKIEKKFDINPLAFFPRPKINSSLLIFTPNTNYAKICSARSLETITRIFFNERRKKIKKPLNKIFKNIDIIKEKLDLNPDLRPHNLNNDIYYQLAKELDNLTG